MFLFAFQLRKKILEKSKDGTLVKVSNGDGILKPSEPRKRGRWDQTIDEQFVPAKKITPAGAVTPSWGDDVSTYLKLYILNYLFLYIFFLENSSRSSMG